ncbi:MAG TPA: YIP1 family protein [Verrucomicrobiae bacterium]|nr:YIP1 family protein [Verrucomicrobiae bacterium]
MVRALSLLFAPDKTWERMALKPPNIAFIVLVSLLPLMAVTLAVEGYGLLHLGEVNGGIGKQLQLSEERVIRYAVFYAAASLLVIVAGSLLLKSVAESFGVNTSFTSSFVLIGCGFMPIFLLRIADGIPQVNTWICWAIGAALAVRILYHGVALWLKPEQTKGFGLFLVSVVYTAVLSGLVHFAAIQVLHGKLLRNVYPEKEPAALGKFSGAVERPILISAFYR